jgi:hypothetical protein
MYHGEVQVAEENLQSFLHLAGKLGVAGFTPAIGKLPYPTLPKPPYLMDIVVPVPRVRRYGSATSMQMRERPGLPLAPVGFATPHCPSPAPSGPPTPSPQAHALRRRPQVFDHSFNF